MSLSKMNLGVGERGALLQAWGLNLQPPTELGMACVALAPVLEAQTAIMLGLTDWPAAYPRDTGSPGSVREHFSEEQRW